MYGAFEGKEIWYGRIENIMYIHDIGIKYGQIHHLSLKIKIYMISF